MSRRLIGVAVVAVVAAGSRSTRRRTRGSPIQNTPATIQSTRTSDDVDAVGRARCRPRRRRGPGARGRGGAGAGTVGGAAAGRRGRRRGRRGRRGSVHASSVRSHATSAPSGMTPRSDPGCFPGRRRRDHRPVPVVRSRLSRAGFTRPVEGRLVAGVARGIGDALGLDANVVRCGFVVLVARERARRRAATASAWAADARARPEAAPRARRAVDDPVATVAFGAVVLGGLLLARAIGLVAGRRHRVAARGGDRRPRAARDAHERGRRRDASCPPGRCSSGSRPTRPTRSPCCRDAPRRARARAIAGGVCVRRRA